MSEKLAGGELDRSSVVAKPSTDWSRTTRKSLALLKSSADPTQSKITSFFEVVDKVAALVEESSTISEMMQALQDRRGFERHTNGFSPLFRQLMLNAEKNIEKLPKQRPHQELLKKFSISLFIYCGPIAYDFIQSNMPEALPSLRTVQRDVSNDYRPIHEGEFRFKELLEHLNAFKSPKVVAIGEDATRVISRIEYDSETNKLVGFVLPCNDQGLPKGDSFIAVSFASIEESFRVAEVAKYAFVYMAQPLCEIVPAFCLAVMGTDNKFTAEDVLKRWNYLVLECKKFGISVVSFGADGDSRELKAMQVSTQLSYNDPIVSLSPSSSLPKLIIPTKWMSWFAVKCPTSIAYIQDIVHIAVKMKSRLIKPSIVLPLGTYLAGVHHLRLIQQTFGKDQHGLRERDINHKDKQNYDAVLHITSESVMSLLKKIPDAKGTHAYLDVLRSVIDSFLDKKLDKLTRIKKAWYGVFFARYWRQWLLLKPDYCLGNNFLTPNAYMCIELNAHSLITFLLTVRDTLPSNNGCFVPWMLGSQSCEKIFRAARSMSSTFSTIINFGLLGLLRRLHRLHIQTCNEAQSDETGIKFPKVEAHKKKDGHAASMPTLSECVSNKDIARKVEEGKEMAKMRMVELGMAELLRESKCWENPPAPVLPGPDENKSEKEDEDEEEVNSDECIPEVMQEMGTTLDPESIASEITEMVNKKIIDKDLGDRLKAVHNSSFKRLASKEVNISTFTKAKDNQDLEANGRGDLEAKGKGKGKSKCSKSKHCRFVEVTQNEKTVYISKTTAVWLLQEGERVSTDRLFRVRNKQPYTCDAKPDVRHVSDAVPNVSECLNVGDICVFNRPQGIWQIGRVLQFSFYMETTKSAKQYRGMFVSLTPENKKKIGVLCSWYSVQPGGDPAMFTQEQSEETHLFQPITTYVCTLSRGCFSSVANTLNVSVMNLDQDKIDLATARSVTLTETAFSFINNTVKNADSKPAQSKQGTSRNKPIVVDQDTQGSLPKEECWCKCGDVELNRKDLQIILRGKKLTDKHIDAFHNLARNQFPDIGGFQTTLLQKKSPLQRNEVGISLQVYLYIGEIFNESIRKHLKNYCNKIYSL
jgi:hypothetical protein